MRDVSHVPTSWERPHGAFFNRRPSVANNERLSLPGGSHALGDDLDHPGRWEIGKAEHQVSGPGRRVLRNACPQRRRRRRPPPPRRPPPAPPPPAPPPTA